jgi:Pvc16 N-terminal domain
MSNALAIAAVTETLVSLIGDSLAASGVAVPGVTALSPDGPGPFPNPGVNVFLYQVTPNTAYRNFDLPTRAADGSLLRKPQVALDLHYLLTFYGNDAQLEQQRLLGATALALHANPTLPRSRIKTVQSDPALPFLSTSTLDLQAELIRFTPVVFSLEELSKLWSFLLKTDYVLSAAYIASVVLIETDDAVPPPPPPVIAFTGQAQAAPTPVITAVAASPDPTAPIVDGAAISLQGVNLAAPGGGTTQVLVTGTTLVPTAATSTSVTVSLTSGQFSAGPQTAQILQPATMGIPPVLHSGTGPVSGIAAFVLVPSIGPGAPSVSGSTLTVPVIPTIQPGQRVLAQLTPKVQPAAVRLVDGGVLTVKSDAPSFPLTGVAPGSYFVQVLVDGAISPLTPFGGPPSGPLITV